MPTDPQEFIDLADELIGGEFAAFAADLVVSEPGAMDPVTGAVTGGATDTVKATREEYSVREIDGNIIKMGDYKLIAEAVEFANTSPTKSGVTATYEGKTINIVRATQDAAKATWTIQARHA